MLTEEIQDTCARFTIRIAEPAATISEPLFEMRERADEGAGSEQACGLLFEFVANSPVTFAERFPRLMFCAVALALLLTAITAEIDCLRAAGYYWP
jgi:hypothetical protein